MSFVRNLIIAAIFVLNGILLLNDGVQRNQFHTNIQTILNLTKLNCSCITFEHLQTARYLLVSLLFGSAVGIFEKSRILKAIIILTSLIHLAIFNNPSIIHTCHVDLEFIRSTLLNFLVFFLIIQKQHKHQNHEHDHTDTDGHAHEHEPEVTHTHIHGPGCSHGHKHDLKQQKRGSVQDKTEQKTQLNKKSSQKANKHSKK